MFCFKQPHLNSNFLLDLCHFSFGERPLFPVVGGFVISFDNPLGYHDTVVSVWLANIAKVLKIGLNIKIFCDPSLIK